MMVRGVIIRHLALPGQLADSEAAVKELFSRFGNRFTTA